VARPPAGQEVSVSVKKTRSSKLIQFTDPSGHRRTIRLGKVTKEVVQAIRAKVNDLNAARNHGVSPSRETIAWLKESCGDVLRRKLVNAGLVHPSASMTINEWITTYLAERADIRASTKVVIGRARKALIAFFGADKRLGDVTLADASRFGAWLRTDRTPRLAEQTARRMTGIARQLWKAARRRGLVDSDPFADLPVVTGGNASRMEMVSGDTIRRVIEVAPSAEWRLLLAVARWGAFRIVSEIRGLRWADVDFERGVINLPEPKTAKVTGRQYRPVPIFPEIRPWLQEAFDAAAEGEAFVFAELRGHSAQRISKQFKSLLKRVGVKPWPKPWQNLRATRATELADRFPAHVVAAWLGHTVAVATKHYLQVTDSHLAAALADPSETRAAKALQHLPE
jgi:integrase